MSIIWHNLISTITELMRKILQHGFFHHPHLRPIVKGVIIFFGIIAIIILCLSPIVKYMVEKYDVKYTGREITMSSAYVNPFTGYIHFNNFRMYEQNSDSVFLSAKQIAARFVLRKLFSKTYEVSSLVLKEPHGILIQYDKKTFNFSDMIEKFSPDTVHVDTAKKVPI